VSRWPVAGPSGYRLLASSPTSKVKRLKIQYGESAMHAGYVTSHKHTHTQTHTHTHAHTGFVTFPLHQLLQCNASQCYVIIRRLPVVLRKVNRSVCPLIPRFDTSRILVFTVSTYEMFTRPDVCRTVHHFAS